MMDYVDTNGELIRCGKPNGPILIRTADDLALLAGLYAPGAVAMTPGGGQMWQLGPDGAWAPVG